MYNVNKNIFFLPDFKFYFYLTHKGDKSYEIKIMKIVVNILLLICFLNM